jgi:CRISPR/Cas system CSM-associated protein Csm3 (group 7 of RAMP superfamily)
MPLKTSRMRTAIDGKTGTAAKSQLYGYESLNAGQSFVGKIEWDDSVAELITPIINIFNDGEVLHIGRSKTASYGRVKVSKIEIMDNKVVHNESFLIIGQNTPDFVKIFTDYLFKRAFYH